MQPQRITRNVQFEVYQNPGTDAHLDQVIESFCKAKGIIYKDQTFYIK